MSDVSGAAGGRVFVPLARPPFTAFLNGSKSVEIRNASSPVAAQVRRAKPGARVVLRLGYNGAQELHGTLGKVWSGLQEGMPGWAREGACLDWSVPSPYFKAGGHLIAFEVLR